MSSANKYRIVLLNILLWAGLYVIWIFVFQNRALTFSRTLGIEFCYLVFIAFNFYFNIYFAIPGLLSRRKYVGFALLSLAVFAVTSWLRANVVLFINSYFYNVQPSQINFGRLYLISLLNIFIWTVCLISGKLILDKLKFQRYVEAVEKEKILNELNFLRAQNNPHLLFNSLNSLYFQIEKSNGDARETLMRLSEMLRYQLYDCSAEKIQIDKEITYLGNYIELQKLRLNKNYNIIFAVDPEVSNFSIAPLLIIPFIENAFKYVSHYSDKSNEINIHFGRKDGQFLCGIMNTSEKTSKAPDATKGGIGLKNLQRRLELLYPGKHEIIFNITESQYAVKLTLKADEN